MMICIENKMTIEQMTIADYTEVFTLWKNTKGIGLHADSDSLEGIEAYLQRNPNLSLIAKQNGKIIGTLLCGHDGRRGYLHHLTVDRSYRNKGVAKSLVRQAVSGLASIGISKCHVFIFSDNLDGHEFWKRVGWDDRVDLIVMSKTTG